MSAAAAAPAGSILNWWQNNVDPLATEAMVWGDLDNSMQYWTIPSDIADGGYSAIELEVAGHANYNYFGWYKPTGTADVTRHQIFDGLDNPASSPVTYYIGASGTKFGFYLDYESYAGDLQPSDVHYTPDYSFFSEDARNGDDSPVNTDYRGVAGPANDWGTTGYRHVRVFDDPAFYDSGTGTYTGWILAWEDLPAANTSTDEAQYGTAWSDSSSLNWTEGSTADGPDWDYNDMIVKFHLVDATPPTPELATWLLLSLSLAAVPVLRRRRRS